VRDASSAAVACPLPLPHGASGLAPKANYGYMAPLVTIGPESLFVRLAATGAVNNRTPSWRLGTLLLIA